MDSEGAEIPEGKVWVMADHSTFPDYNLQAFNGWAVVRINRRGIASVYFADLLVNIAAAAPGYASTFIRGVKLSAENSYAITLTKGQMITGLVKNEMDRPIPSVLITAKKNDGPFNDEDDFMLKTEVDNQGRFQLKNVSAGSWLIKARSLDPAWPQYLPPVKVQVREDNQVEPVEIKGQKGFRIKGKIVSRHKVDLKRRIFLSLIAPSPDILLDSWREWTSEDGHFDIWGLPCDIDCFADFSVMKGYYRTLKIPEKYSYFRSFEYGFRSHQVPPGTYEDIELHYLLAGRIKGRIIDPLGYPLKGLEISSNPDGFIVRADENGKYIFPNAPPLDEVYLQIRDPKNLSSCINGETFSVQEGQFIEKDFIIRNGDFLSEWPPLAGRNIPGFETLGMNFDPEQIKNKSLLICFWDMSQRPSRQYMQQLAEKFEALKQLYVMVIGVQTSDVERNQLDDWLAENDVSFPVGIIQGDEKEIRFTWRVRALPWLILTDKEHVVRAEGFGAEELEDILKINQDAAAKQIMEQLDKGDQEKATVAEIMGVVRDAAGAPVANAEIRIIPSLGSTKALTDSEGMFKIFWDSRQAEAAYDSILNAVVEQKPSKLLARQVERNLVAMIDIDEEIQIQEIELKEGITLSGKVTVKDTHWEGNFHADISVAMMVSRWLIPLTEPNMVTDAMDRYQVRALTAEQSYWVEATGKDFGRVIKVVHGYDAVENRLEAPDLVLPLANESVSGMVVDENNKPIAGALVRISGPDQPFHSTETDADGKFTINQVCPGWLQITALISGPEYLYGKVIVDAGDTNVKIIARDSETEEPKSLIGQPLPKWEGLNLKISDEQIKEKALLVCFWDMQQRPSRHWLTQLAEHAQKLAQDNITIIALESSMVDNTILTEWLAQNKIPFPVGTIKENPEETKFRWGVRGLPWLILTDEKHLVQAEGFGLEDLDVAIGGKRQVYLPHEDRAEVKGKVLDLASGQMLSTEGVEDGGYFERLGRGDLLYETFSRTCSLVFIRQAIVQQHTDLGLISVYPDIIDEDAGYWKAYVLYEVPCQFIVTTPEQDTYEINVLEIDPNNADWLRIEYQSSRYRLIV
ncbi:carboxypeptidase regulatory-like domain-containing protein, partial [Planctomycetota bacterium]